MTPSQVSPSPSAQVYRGPKLTIRPTEDYLERHLWKWAQWMRSGQAVRWYPSASCGMGNGGASQHFEDMLEAEERRIAAVTNTVINDLPAVQSCAVHHAYLFAVYRFRDEVALSRALELAKVRIRSGLKAKSIWLGE